MGSNEAVFADDGVVEDGCPHAYQGVVADCAAVNDSSVSDRNAVTDRYGGESVRGVNEHVFLKVGLGAYRDRLYIAAYDGVKKHRTALADRNGSYDPRVWRNKRGARDAWCGLFEGDCRHSATSRPT